MHVATSPCFQGRLHDFGVHMTGQKDNLATGTEFPDSPGGFDATQPRKADVQENQTRLQFSNFLKGLQSVGCETGYAIFGMPSGMILDAISPKSKSIADD